MEPFAMVAVAAVISGSIGVFLGRMSAWSIISERDYDILILREKLELLSKQVHTASKRGAHGRFVKRNKGEVM